MTPSPDTSNAPTNPGQPPVDPVIAALLATGAPVQITPPQPAAPTQAADAIAPSTAPPIAPPGFAPSMLNPPGGPVSTQSQIGAGPQPADPYASPGNPINPYDASPSQGGAPVPVVSPNGLGGKPTPAFAPGDVVGATNAQNQAVTTQAGNIASEELAKTDALASHANARATIMDGHATAQGLVDQQYQRARDAARNDSLAEAAAWQRDLDKKVAEEPVPGRWFARQSGFSRVMYIASLAFGALAQSHNANLKNVGLEMITQEINADIQEQRDKLKRQVDALNKKGDRIDKRLADRLADSKDEHAMISTRLVMIQQSAIERANAPGPADQKAAMLEAAQWAGQQRLSITGARADKAYTEREGKLTRDAENARAYLTDKRERDLKAAELQKDYDLAKITAGSKLDAVTTERLKDSVVLPPSTTGIRVVDKDTGQPVASALSSDGGLTVSKANERTARQTADIASEKFAAMKRLSFELGKDEDVKTLLKRNPQLISDIVKLGYQGARNELDPSGRVTDKDFVAGMEHELGGDLETLSGRVASATFSAGHDKLKALVDKHIRDYPAFVSNRLGALLDGAMPGYEGKNLRVDWTPHAVEIGEPDSPTTRQIDSSYGIKTPLKPPSNLDELKQAQDLEKRGVEALPPYKAGSRDKVTKALEDFKGAMPDTIDARGRAIADKLYDAGDTRAVLEVEQAKYAEMKKAKSRLDNIEKVLSDVVSPDGTVGIKGGGPEEKVINHLSRAQLRALSETKTIPVGAVTDIAKMHGITQLTGDDVLNIIKKVGLHPGSE